MHNLFLGTAKRIMHHWIDKKILSKQDLYKIEKSVKRHHARRSCGPPCIQ